MKLQTLAAACAAFAALAVGSTAFAAEPVTIKLQAPVAAKTKFIAGGAMFVCEADACVAGAATPQTFAVSTCRTVAEKVGAVAAFSGRRALDPAQLADCNHAAAAPGATQLAKQ